MDSRLNAHYLPSYRFDKKSYMSFRLVQKSVTLNGSGAYFALFKLILPNLVMGLILHYFTEFV